MHLDSETSAPQSLATPSKKPSITISNARLSARQRRFALATVLIPLVGVVLAVVQIFLAGITQVELVLLASLYTLTMLGITVGFHRQFAHCAFRTPMAIRVILAILGCMAAQGPIIFWVSNHRRHHQYSDQREDPHSPHIHSQLGALTLCQGLWHAHIGWMFDRNMTNSMVFAKDLLQDPIMTRINRLYLLWVILGLSIPAILGGLLLESWIGVLRGLLWGGLVRIFLVHQITWSINSITHLLGSRPFHTRENSTNNSWLAIPSGGEAWHNNHHAFPNSAKFGLEWWQVDLGYWVIRGLEMLGLAWDVKIPTAGMIAAKKTV
jgi:stearoyl-CoA desaturase (delta-9 desaturase)